MDPSIVNDSLSSFDLDIVIGAGEEFLISV